MAAPTRGEGLLVALRDERWAEARDPRWLMAAATFGILALELALIRWSAGQVRIVAYLQNLVLIGAFLGMGLGVALGPRWPGLIHAALPVLLPFAWLLAVADEIGLTHLRFPNSGIVLWGAERGDGVGAFALAVAVVLLLFWATAAVFVCAGAAVGHLFRKLATLRAYAWDLAGSTAGVLAMAGVTGLGVGPEGWLFLGLAPLYLLSRRPLSLLCALLIGAAGWYSGRDAVFSPYNRIDFYASAELGERQIQLNTNRDFHQTMQDLSRDAIESLPEALREGQVRARLAYDLPFVIGRARERALVVAAGTGNDVQAALRAGFGAVVSVDIDPTILALGRELHPEQPYADRRVSVVNDDARAFFDRYGGPPFDVVAFGLLDSHAMFSAMSSLRLESFVYTVEGIRAAWRLVAPGGLLSISFSGYAGDWITDRLYWTIAEATGIEPRAVGPTIHHGRSFLVTRDWSRFDPKVLGTFAPVSAGERARTTTTSDDWPFLYLEPGRFPLGYAVVLLGVLASGFAAARRVFGPGLGRDFHLPLFLMGAAFLLLETRGVTALSLLFGSTWVVNASVFAGILFTAWLANLAAERLAPQRLARWFVPLFVAMAVVLSVEPAQLSALPMLARAVCGGLLVGLPVGCAGIVVSALLARAERPSAALGSNLLGSLLGGCLEYLSMAVGLRALLGLALLLYLGAFAATLRQARASPPG